MRRGVIRRPSNLKRDLLLFDQLLVAGLEQQAEALLAAGESIGADLLYLAQEGAAAPAPATRYDLLLEFRAELAELDDDTDEDLPSDRQRFGLLMSTAGHPSGVIPIDEALPAGLELAIAAGHRLSGRDPQIVAVLDAPLTSVERRRLEATLILPGNPWYESRDADHADRVERMIEITIERLPVPCEEVPLEDVLAFTRTGDVQRQMTTLRHWMTKAARGEASATELGEEIVSLLHDFTQHMRLADMRHGQGVLRVLVGSTVEAIEELLHLRPKKAMDALFGIADRSADRLEAELSAPGHEFAYLYRAERQFGRR